MNAGLLELIKQPTNLSRQKVVRILPESWYYVSRFGNTDYTVRWAGKRLVVSKYEYLNGTYRGADFVFTGSGLEQEVHVYGLPAGQAYSNQLLWVIMTDCTYCHIENTEGDIVLDYHG